MAFLTLSLSTLSLSYKLRLLPCVLFSVFAAAARTASLWSWRFSLCRVATGFSGSPASLVMVSSLGVGAEEL